MGLTKSSVGIGAVDSGLIIKKQSPNDKIIALAGNPNVGKSTVFNALTGLNQHTGNWPGKTVANAQGYCKSDKHSFVLVDIPGTYSLMAHSAEEEVARNFICFGAPDAVAVVCDATCLERNMNLVLQTLEISSNVIVCVNLMDEAKRKKINIDLKKLEERLGVPVIGVTARKKKSLKRLLDALDAACDKKNENSPYKVIYSPEIEKAITLVEPEAKRLSKGKINSRWLSLKLLDGDSSLLCEICGCLGDDFLKNPALFASLNRARETLQKSGITREKLKDSTVSAVVAAAEKICDGAVTYEKKQYSGRDRRIDRLLTGKLTAYPFMFLLLGVIFWLTITGANYPSELLSRLFALIGDKLDAAFTALGAPDLLHGALVDGVYRVLTSVIAVMLPPMAIFFPLFTLLEDSGYLPRIAYNLDRPFKRCKACGKQALTICMGFGCNAAGIVGCRIIDSPRERLLAVLTNNFIPCNGRFPMLISIITMFFVTGSAGGLSSLFSVAVLTLAIIFSVGMTLVVTKLLSKTLLKGVPSSFTLELPPYRRPQIGKVIVRSVFDRTLFVLGRAASVAAPAGLIIWLMANVTVSGSSLLSLCADFLDPLGKLMGLDGVILFAFILGFPANEIVVPIIMMTYLSAGTINSAYGLAEMQALFVSNGWNAVTAICFIIFTLMHWPCSTTLLTIKKETGSLKWTFLAAAIPTAIGIALCILVNFIASVLL
ncbi:MAG: ferrous iron transport protein B [Acutalibacteraceae bacterium]|nr:ferrous iron transport protein B [Acutalibacteraceae bacterium]